MPELKPQASLAELQQYMRQVCAERGWDSASPLQTFLLMSEEIGELAKAIRQHEGLFSEEAKAHKKFALEEEFADVFSYLLDLANQFDVDLEKAFRKKEIINEQRHWKSKQ
jgi:NTP pyrophosphatase (non-canonical NTP hydrolase)